MKRLSRLILVLVLLAALLPVRTAMAQSAEVNCQTVAASLGASYQEGALTSDRGVSQYCVIIPAKWNGDVVLFAHGYVPPTIQGATQPAQIPWDQAIRGNLNLPGILTQLGYAFAITSYSKTGLAVKEGVLDVIDLANAIKQQNPNGRIFLTGASEGGLVTTLAVEKEKALFSGGLSTCGPIGDFQAQINYWGDFRVIFDHYFPAQILPLGGNAMNVPQTAIDAWGDMNGPLVALVLNAISAPDLATQTKVAQLLSASKAPFDPKTPATIAQTVLGILDYNIRATNEGETELGGVPFFNQGKVYTSSPPDPTLNGDVARFTASPAALAQIKSYYQTSGVPKVPLVVMHTSGDPIVPAWHAQLYLKKAFLKGTLQRVTYIPISRYGHCSFTPVEAVIGFYAMVLKATAQPFSMTQVKAALPSATDQQKFLLLKAALH